MYFSCFTPGIGINWRRRDHEKYFGFVFVPFPFIFLLLFFFFIFSVVSSKVEYRIHVVEVMWWVVKKIIRFGFFLGILWFVDILHRFNFFFFLILKFKVSKILRQSNKKLYKCLCLIIFRLIYSYTYFIGYYS